MKRLITGLAILAASAAVAQESPQVVSMPTYCVDVKTLEQVIDAFDELPYIKFNNARTLNDRSVSNPTVVFINFQTGSYTIAERVTNEHFCVIAMGDGFEAVDEKVRQDITKRREKSSS